MRTLVRAAAAVCAAAVLASCAGADSSSTSSSAPAAVSDVLELDGELVKDITPLDERSVERFAEKIRSVAQEYCMVNNRVFCAVIPDKAQFTDGAPRVDFGAVCAALDEALPDMTHIGLSGALGAGDYYRTDGHWRQERLQGVADALGDAMGFSVDLSAFEAHTFDGFLGAYAEDAEDAQPETLVWLTSAATDSAVQDNYQAPDVTDVYDTARLESAIPYDVYLSGATPAVTVTTNAGTGRELVIFRDSFASSLAPLLCGVYDKITLLDLRYMATPLLEQFVTFDDQDVLFLYSMEVVNNSAMLR